tara:strand:+ start:541 stop:723 length:183 start_codon:yes stop_codon:yes gene_type:complete
MHTIKLTTEEVFELLQITGSVIQINRDEDLLSAHKKLANIRMPESSVIYDYDYEPPIYGQ